MATDGSDRLLFWQLLSYLGITKSMVHPENVAQGMGGLAAFLAMLGSVVHILRHLFFNHTKLRTCTVRILLVVPMFALASFFSLLSESSRFVQVWACLREIYEAVALASFMQFIFTVLGGPYRLASKMVQDGAKPVHHFWPLRLLPGLKKPYGAGADFVSSMIVGILQYIFFMIVVLLVKTAIMVAVGPESKLMIVPNGVKALSCFWALACLVLFAHEVHHLLPQFKLVLKFLSIKGVVFFTFWQTIVINAVEHIGLLSVLKGFVTREALKHAINRQLYWDNFEIKSGINDFLLCNEMLFFTVLHFVAYPVREFDSETPVLIRCATEGTVVSRLLKALRLDELAEMYTQVVELRKEVLTRTRSALDPLTDLPLLAHRRMPEVTPPLSPAACR